MVPSPVIYTFNNAEAPGTVYLLDHTIARRRVVSTKGDVSTYSIRRRIAELHVYARTKMAVKRSYASFVSVSSCVAAQVCPPGFEPASGIHSSDDATILHEAVLWRYLYLTDFCVRPGTAFTFTEPKSQKTKR